MSLDFTAVDFETANGFRGSPCAVGLVRVRGGVEVDSFYAEMRPPEGFDRFDPRHVEIHGIAAEQVRLAPRFADLFPRIRRFIGEDMMVAHNASFDVEVFESALEVSGLDSPGLRCLCSVKLSRNHYELASHALPASSACAGYSLTRHHYALDDARAAAAIVCDIAARSEQPDIEVLFAASDIPVEHVPAWQGERSRESAATRQVRPMQHLFDARRGDSPPSAMPDLMRWQDEGPQLQPNPEADPSGAFFGVHIVLTGTLGVPRAELKAVLAGLGAQTGSRVTGRTTLVVVGDGFSEADLGLPVEQTPALQSRKARDGLRRRAQGQLIRFVSEGALAAELGSDWPVPSAYPGAHETAETGAVLTG
ncbi:MAG TPA: 3'-5' exoribonuclease [Candidatus Nesterenkonia stercoripullorum]|uniref:3'-5' exoribonuclease n=1 Tax=Candidatus Nesterenkonia stercoripullorum TaxID=2838701 RepID=A0A9D1US91_9MICC|nr:3'-5' exoribonuclease [Candidatus Nesterenkonia stercoripullorum]